jgi:Ca2+-binding RTX toxin-like protein
MSDDIGLVKVSARSLIDQIFTGHDGDESRVAIVGFKDPGEDTTILSFTNQATAADREAAALTAINSIEVSGGGDTPEGHYSALLYALTGAVGAWREDVNVRRIVLFSDAPPKDQYLQAQVEAAARDLGFSIPSLAMSVSEDGLASRIDVSAVAADGTPINRSVEIYTVLVGSDSSASTALQTIADANRGLQFFASDASGVVDSLIDAVTTPYLVAANGTAGDDTLFGTLVGDRIVGGAGSDTIYANAGDDYILGQAGADRLYGGPGNDRLDGGTGDDILTGDDGDDTYLVDSAGDRIVEIPGAGNDTAIASVNYTLPSNVERLELAGTTLNGTGGAGANTLIGNASNNVLDGGDGADVMIGRGGNDIYFVDNALDVPLETANDGTDQVWALINGYTLTDNVEALVLLAGVVSGNGNASRNTLVGNASANILDGGGNADSMSGRAGDDIYYVDDPGDVVGEVAGEGTDTIRTFVSYALPANVERIELLGSAANADGNSAANTLIGSDGGNSLNGNGGADLMIGRGGDDVYYVDNGGDVVLESPGGGYDRVLAYVSTTLTDNVERLELLSNVANGTGNADVNTIIGNVSDNIINGGGGADVMIGRAGNDTYFVDNPGDFPLETAGDGVDQVWSFVNYQLPDNVENLQIYGTATNATGNGGANTIIGNSNANLINGGGGADVMVAGPGDDIYFVDNPGDQVIEIAGEGNADAVWSFIDYTLPANIERLELVSTTAINGSGNSGANTIIGNDNNNVINGNGGADLMIGRGGNDIYFMDNGSDVVLESSGGGYDQVWSYVSATLTDNVEGLTLLGGALNGAGNAGANIIVGNTQNNILTGNGGADTFVLHSGFGRDSITDFGAGPALDDVIQFSDGLFSSFSDVMLHATQSGADVLISHDAANVLTLAHVSLANLQANDFLLV